MDPHPSSSVARLFLAGAVTAFVLALTPHAVLAQAVPPAPADQSAAGQTPSSPQPATPVVTPAPNDVITLTPFTVNEDQDEGYLANNTLAGSRMNTPLADTAASLEVFTPQFMSDIGANNLADVMIYANNTAYDLDEGTAGGANGNALTNFQQYRVRGEDITFARNYFDINGGDMPLDMYNVERVEESRGPNAILFGIGSPAGVVDVDTKMAQLNANFTDVTAKVGSYDSWRVMIDANQTMDDGKFAIRVNATDFDLNQYRYYTFDIGKMAALAMKYELTKKIELRVEAETAQTHDADPDNEPEFDQVTSWIKLGKPSFAPNDQTVNFTSDETNTYPYAGGQQINNWGQNPTNTLNGQTLTYIQSPGQSNQGQLMNLEGQVDTNAYYYPAVLPIDDPALASARINTKGPGGGRFARYWTWTAFLDAELLPNLFLEAAYNHLTVNGYAWNNSGGNTLSVDPNTTLPNGQPNPYYGQFYNETNWQYYSHFELYDRGRISLSYEKDFGKWWGKYRVAVDAERENHGTGGGSYSEAYTGAPFDPGVPDNYLNLVYRRSYVVQGDWSTYYMMGPTGEGGFLHNAYDPISGTSYDSEMVPTSLVSERSEQNTILAAGQAYLLDNKLVIGAGVRRDTLDSFDRGQTRDPNTGVLEIDNSPADGTYQNIGGNTASAGAVIHVTKFFDLIADRSTNFNLPTPDTFTLNGQGVGGSASYELQPAPKGTGSEWGFAINIVNNVLYFKAVRFYTNATNNFDYPGYYTPAATNELIVQAYQGAGLISAATEALHDTSQYPVYLYNEVDDGYEFSLVANPTKHWRLEGNFSINNPDDTGIMANDIEFWNRAKQYYAQFPQGNNLVTQLGDTVGQEIAETDANIADITSVEGVGEIGFRKYKANFFTRYDFSQGLIKGIYIGGGDVWQSKMLIAQPVPSILEYSGVFSQASGLLGYQFKVLKHPAFIQLNVSNLFNDTTPIVYRRNTLSGEGNTFPTSAEFPNPRAYEFTANYKF